MGTLYSVTSRHGATLGVASDGKIVNMKLGSLAGDRRPVYLYRPSSTHSACFLFAEIAFSAQLRLHPQHSVGCLVPVFIIEDKLEGVFSLYSPKTGAFLTMAPIADGEIEGAMAFSALKVRDWEKVSFDPVLDSKTIAAFGEIISCIDALTTPSISVDTLFDSLNIEGDIDLRASVLNAVAMCLAARKMKYLVAKVITENIEILENLQKLFPNDPFAQYGLHETLLLLKSQGVMQTEKKDIPDQEMPSRDNKKYRKNIGRVFDALHQDVTFVKDFRFPAAVNYQLRKLVKPTQRACIVSSARNEGLYLLEWISYHRSIGFDHIFIYSNDNQDGSDELLGALANLGVITWLSNEAGDGIRVQMRSFAHALSILPDVLNYQWTAVLDLDEFFIPNARFGNLPSFLDWHETRPVDAIAINWKMIEPGSEVRWRDELLMRRFQLARCSVERHIKTIFRTNLFVHSLPHFPTGPWGEEFVFRNASGELHQYDKAVGQALSSNPSQDKAFIAHYFYKSNEEMLWKGSRNRGGERRDSKNAFGGLKEGFIREFVGWEERPTELLKLNDLAAKTDREMARLLENPHVRGAWEGVKMCFQERMPTLINAAFDHPAIVAADEAGARFMAPFAQEIGNGK